MIDDHDTLPPATEPSLLPDELDTLVEVEPFIPAQPRSPDSLSELAGKRSYQELVNERLDSIPVILDELRALAADRQAIFQELIDMHAEIKRAREAAEKSEASSNYAKSASREVFDDYFAMKKEFNDTIVETQRRVTAAEGHIAELKLNS